MGDRLRRAALILLLATAGPRAAAGDSGLSPPQREQIEKALPLLRRPFDVARLRELRRRLSRFELDDLARLADAPEFAKLTPPQQQRLAHAARAIRFAETHAKLQRPWRAGLLLGSGSSRDRFAGLRVLYHEPFTDALDPVVVSLSKSPHPELRLGAGRLAKLLTVFAGPCDSRAAVAKRLLVDPVPNVAAMFGAYDAHDFGDKEILDLMVERFRDKRELLGAAEVAQGLAPWTGTVADALRGCLQAEFLRHFAGVDVWKPVPGNQLRQWWRRNRAFYVFGANPEMTRLLVDWKGVCTLGEAYRVGLDADETQFKVESYDESWSDDRPQYSALLRVRWLDRMEDFAGLGPNNAEEGERVRGGLGFGMNRVEVEYFIVPDHEKKYRVRLRLWVRR